MKRMKTFTSYEEGGLTCAQVEIVSEVTEPPRLSTKSEQHLFYGKTFTSQRNSQRVTGDLLVARFNDPGTILIRTEIQDFENVLKNMTEK